MQKAENRERHPDKDCSSRNVTLQRYKATFLVLVKVLRV